MYIVGARMQARPGKAGAAAPKVAQLRDAMAELSGGPVRAWSAVAGAPVGSFIISGPVDGMADVIDHIHRLTGRPGFLATVVAGNLLEMISGFGWDSGAEWDAASRSMAGDPAYLAHLNGESEIFVPGSGQQAVMAQMP